MDGLLSPVAVVGVGKKKPLPHIRRADEMAATGLGLDDPIELLPTSGVVGFFRARAKGLLDGGVTIDDPTHAPVATRSMAPMAIAGTLGDPVGELPDPTHGTNRYRLYDLSQVTPGGYVWRVSRHKNRVNADIFVRGDGEQWRHYRVDLASLDD